ncbi:MAG: GDSL-type esterase/lipase family protein [Calditrichota bacterium]
MNKEKNSRKISPMKRILFTGIALLIPVLILTAAEGILRLTDIGAREPLINTIQQNGELKHQVNRKVAQRYFSIDSSMVPEASEDVFDVVRREGSLRILCIGGSTTAGFPYEINATFPFQLQHRLRVSLLNNYVEVINLGISAINSYSVVDLLPEMLEIEPDVLIVYMGHNEFYGAFGAASSQYVSANHRLNRLYLYLRKFRIVNALRSLFSGLVPVGESTDERMSLMQAMAAENQVPPDSPIRQRAVHQFRENLRDIVDAAKKAGVQVVLSTLVSNLADQPPLLSGSSADLNEREKILLEKNLLEAQEYLAGNEFTVAEAILNRLDSTSASRSYLTGKLGIAKVDFKSAEENFRQARDLDVLPFRAPHSMNVVIREMAETEDVPLIDMEAIFNSAAPNGLPGSTLFTEHLHPTFYGYQLMAQTYYHALRKLEVLTSDELAVWDKALLTEEDVHTILKDAPLDRAGVTRLDEEIADIRIFFLTHRWPFANIDVQIQDYVSDTPLQLRQIAYSHIKGEISWDNAHYAWAESLLDSGKADEAILEFLAVRKVSPENPYPAMRLGDVFYTRGKVKPAKSWFERALKTDPGNPFALAKLGNVLVNGGEFRNAVDHLTRALQARGENNSLNSDQKLTAWYLLAISYANLKEFEPANKAINQCLAINASYAPALTLRQQIAAFRQ